MSETLPVKRQPDPEIDRLARVGSWLAASEAGGKDPQSLGMAAALRLYFCQQLGLPPFAAAELSVINGRLFVGAKLLRALAERAGYRVVRDPDLNDMAATAVLLNGDGTEIGRYTFTREDAERAQLIKPRSAWETHPARMLWARAAKYVLDDYAPSVTLGLWAEDEREEIEGSAAPVPPPPPSPPPPPPAPPQPAAGTTTEPQSASQPPPEGTEVAEEADWHEETEAERRRRLDARLAVVCRNTDTGLLPAGFDSWEGYSRWITKERYGVVSRSELSNDQKQELIGLIETEAIPF
jgi:hypothetical protein